MGVTLNLPASLMQQVRKRAESDRRTVTSVVEQAIRELLARDQGCSENEGDCRPTAHLGANRWSTSTIAMRCIRRWMPSVPGDPARCERRVA